MSFAKKEEEESSPRRGFGRWFSDIASAGREVKRVARETRDAMVLLRHTAKHGEQQASRPPLHHAIQVEVLSATDLSFVKSLPVPYCVVVTGYPDQPWAKKCDGREYKTAPALRERHPRWNALCHVAFPPDQVSVSRVEFGKAAEAPPVELCVRVMDAGGLRGDRMAGEARVRLGASHGAGTYRLMGGGYATLSVRWSIPERITGPGTKTPEEEAFERAANFWAVRDLSTSEGITHAQLELAAILATEPVHETEFKEAAMRPHINEMILQAPLSALLLNDLDPKEIQGAEVQSPGSHSLMTVLSEHLDLLTPLAGSRLVGALVEKLPSFRGSMPLEDPNFLLVQRCGEAWEDFLCKVFLHFQGSKLIELKRLIDAAGGGRDLRHCVYSVITSEVRRAAVLKHFSEEAEKLQDFPLHILSDIDQTVFIGTFGAGGPKFPVGPVPGALPLFRALGARVTFLSARPPIWEGQTRRLLDDIGIAEAVVLPGSLKAVAQVLFAPEQAKQAMAERKTEVFGQFATLHPEAQFIFFGDSGEGDIDFAEEFMAASRASSRTSGHPPRAALIHDVSRADGIMPKSNATSRSELRMRGIHVFDTYAGAALELFMLGLLDAEGLRSAAHGDLEEFGEINVVDFACNEVFETRRMELLRDIREVNSAIRAAELRKRSDSTASSSAAHAYPSTLQEAPPPSRNSTPATSTAKPQAEGPVGPETAEVAPVQEQEELVMDLLGQQEEATPAAASTAKPQAEGPVGPETAEVAPVQEQKELATPAAASTAKPQAEGPVGPETAEVAPEQKELVMDLLGQDEARILVNLSLLEGND
eukprot:s1818_g14.t3